MEFIEGVLKIANVFLAVVAGIIAISLLKISEKRKDLKPWKLLIIALVLFAIQQILGALRAFKIFETAYLTHIIPTAMLVLLLVAVICQINITKKKRS